MENEMKLVTMILIVVSLAACHVEGPEAGEAKFEAKRQKNWKGPGRVSGKNSYIDSPYVLAKAEGYPDQHFVFDMSFMPTYLEYGQVMVKIRAVDNKFRPLKNGCVDKFLSKRNYFAPKRNEENTINIINGQKGIKITWDTQDGIKEFEYTTLDSNNFSVTYKYKRPNAAPLGWGETKKIPDKRFKHIMRAEDCDHVSQSEEEGSAAQ